MPFGRLQTASSPLFHALSRLGRGGRGREWPLGLVVRELGDPLGAARDERAVTLPGAAAGLAFDRTVSHDQTLCEPCRLANLLTRRARLAMASYSRPSVGAVAYPCRW